MTNNQLQYWRNVETERHNRADEMAKSKQAEASAVQAAAAAAKTASDIQWKPEEVNVARVKAGTDIANSIGNILKGVGSIIPF